MKFLGCLTGDCLFGGGDLPRRPEDQHTTNICTSTKRLEGRDEHGSSKRSTKQQSVHAIANHQSEQQAPLVKANSDLSQQLQLTEPLSHGSDLQQPMRRCKTMDSASPAVRQCQQVNSRRPSGDRAPQPVAYGHAHPQHHQQEATTTAAAGHIYRTEASVRRSLSLPALANSPDFRMVPNVPAHTSTWAPLAHKPAHKRAHAPTANAKLLQTDDVSLWVAKAASLGAKCAARAGPMAPNPDACSVERRYPSVHFTTAASVEDTFKVRYVAPPTSVRALTKSSSQPAPRHWQPSGQCSAGAAGRGNAGAYGQECGNGNVVHYVGPSPGLVFVPVPYVANRRLSCESHGSHTSSRVPAGHRIRLLQLQQHQSAQQGAPQAAIHGVAALPWGQHRFCVGHPGMPQCSSAHALPLPLSSTGPPPRLQVPVKAATPHCGPKHAQPMVTSQSRLVTSSSGMEGQDSSDPDSSPSTASRSSMTCSSSSSGNKSQSSSIERNGTGSSRSCAHGVDGDPTRLINTRSNGVIQVTSQSSAEAAAEAHVGTIAGEARALSPEPVPSELLNTPTCVDVVCSDHGPQTKSILCSTMDQYKMHRSRRAYADVPLSHMFDSVLVGDDSGRLFPLALGEHSGRLLSNGWLPGTAE